MSTPPPNGIYVPAVLWFDGEENFDYESIKRHILRLAEGGVTGILVQGSNGEAQHLSHDERKEAIRFTRETLDQNGFPDRLVIGGTGAQSTRETIKLCKDAAEAGAGYALVLTPSVWPKSMTWENIITFFHKVADNSPIPVLIYNFPTVTAGQDLDSDILEELAKHPNIVGTKLSEGNIGKLNRLATSCPRSEFAVYTGKAESFVHALLSGAAGTIAALANVTPKVHKKLETLWKEGKTEEAMKLQAIVSKADWAITKIGGIAGVKSVVAQAFGYGEPIVRGPLKTLYWDGLKKDKHKEALEVIVALEKEL